MASRRTNNPTASDPATGRLDRATSEYDPRAGAWITSANTEVQVEISPREVFSFSVAAFMKILPSASEMVSAGKTRW
jgi:hypothetical protein